MNEEQIIYYMMNKKWVDGVYMCWEFVQDIYRDLYDMELPDYPVDEPQTEFKNRMVSNFRPKVVPNNEAQDGDIVIFTSLNLQHAGVMIDNERFIHLGMSTPQITDLRSVKGVYKLYRRSN